MMFFDERLGNVKTACGQSRGACFSHPGVYPLSFAGETANM
jgi:hypothetical protein